MGHNRVTIFSNGIADFQRSYDVQRGGTTEVSIPVTKEHIGDVLASLSVFGQVKLVSPPSFRPANELEGNIAIDPKNAILDLATSLSGARVEIERAGATTAGTLVGLHHEQEATGGERVQRRFLVILTELGLQKVPVPEVQALRFPDETVQAEIDKSLQRSLQSIKPRSTFVELALATEQEAAEAIVQYTIPAAAWKISYRIRRDAHDHFQFQGFAIVDNNTEEDWNDCLITVVTGEPITFSTDLAESKAPQRKRVNVVRDTALGAVEVEESFAMAAPCAASMAADADYEGGEEATRGLGRYGRQMAARALSAPAADMDLAESREVGDFCIFQAPAPVSIAANRSAVIPVFSAALGNGRTVLHFKRENHPERPYRAVEFTNETAYSLGRGVCTVYEEDTYCGSCIIPSTKPGDDCLLPHALETGVRFRHEAKTRQRKTVGLRLSRGYCYTSFRETQESDYRIRNGKDETFPLILDHENYLTDAGVTCTRVGADGSRTELEVTDSLKNGLRLKLTVHPGEEFAVQVVESRVLESSVQLVSLSAKREILNTDWLEQNLVHSHGPLANDPEIRKCLEIQQSLDAKREEIEEATAETQRLAERQERLRKNIAAGGHDDQTNRWKSDLGAAENRIVELDETVLPQLRDEERQIKQELARALKALAAEWKEDES